ncbi:unnamed protein product, partial [Ectocarpus sp. 12 AP-2014]
GIAAAAAAGGTSGGLGSRDGGSGGDGGGLDSTLEEGRLGGHGWWHDWYPSEGWVDKQQEVLRVHHRWQQQQQHNTCSGTSTESVWHELASMRTNRSVN